MITNYPAAPGRVAGGVQAVSARLVAELRTAPDLDLHVIHCHSDTAEDRVVRDGAATIHYLAQNRQRIVPNMATGVRRIAAELRSLAPDVVNAHGPSFAAAALQAGYRPIWTIHGVLAQEARLYPGVFHRLSFALARWYERRALAAVDLITTVSPSVVEAYRGCGRATCEWRVIENPAPADLFALPRAPMPGRVLMPASVIPLKDPLTLVRAAALVRERLPGLQVRLAGSLADEAYVAHVRGEIARLDLGDCVSLLGALGDAALRDEYTQAAVEALPSRHEVAPMAVIEAMAAGIPVIASSVGGLPWLVEEGRTGRLAPPGQPEAWADALTELLIQPDVARRMGDAGRAAARHRFDPARVAGQYLDAYRTKDEGRKTNDQ